MGRKGKKSESRGSKMTEGANAASERGRELREGNQSGGSLREWARSGPIANRRDCNPKKPGRGKSRHKRETIC